MGKLKNIHPGKTLKNEFLKPLKISAIELSRACLVPQGRISQIVIGNRRITADTAIRLGIFFGNSAEFWLGLQNDYDIGRAKGKKKVEFKKIKLHSN